MLTIIYICVNFKAMESLLINLSCGVLSGIVASIVFLIIISNLKPKIIISPHIVFKDEEYHFKFVNKTKAALFDVRVEVMFVTPFGDKNGKNLRGQQLELVDGTLFHIPKNQKDNKDRHNLFATRCRTREKLKEEWVGESSYIQLTVIARHSFSGINKVFTHDFPSVDCITSTKNFASGNSLDVL